MIKNYLLKPNAFYALIKPFGFFILAVLFAILTHFALVFFKNEVFQFIGIGSGLLVVLMYIYKFLYIKSMSYKITREQIVYTRGVFTITTDNIELYRVKDFTVKRPFLMRIINTMNFSLITSDKTHPILDMVGIPKSNIDQVVRKLVEEQRRIKGVREFD